MLTAISTGVVIAFLALVVGIVFWAIIADVDLPVPPHDPTPSATSTIRFLPPRPWDWQRDDLELSDLPNCVMIVDSGGPYRYVSRLGRWERTND